MAGVPENPMMPNTANLPHLLKLLDDDTPLVRDAVRREPEAFGESLERALGALEPPPTGEERRLISLLLPPEPKRRHRPSGAHFEPGQIVRHVRYGYRGVVVASDPECRTEERWYQANAHQPDREQPWYHVLVDGARQVTYAAQTSLDTDECLLPVRHPLIRLFFTGFDEGLHIRNDRPWPGE